jgi:hypothetical protein
MAKISGFHTSLPKHKILGRVLNHFHTQKYWNTVAFINKNCFKNHPQTNPRFTAEPWDVRSLVFVLKLFFSSVLCSMWAARFHHVSPWKPWFTQYLDLIKFSVARQALIIEWSMIQIHNIRSSPAKKMVHLEMNYIQKWWFFRVKCHIASGHMHPPCHSHGLETAPGDHHRSRGIFDQCGIWMCTFTQWYVVGGWPTPLKNDGVSSSVGVMTFHSQLNG